MVFITPDFLAQMALDLFNIIAMSAVVEAIFTQVLHHTLEYSAMSQFEQILFSTEKRTLLFKGFYIRLPNQFALLRPITGIRETH